MEVPAITHSSGCACSDCQWSGLPSVATKVSQDNGVDASMTKERETTFLSVLNDNIVLFAIAGLMLAVFLFMNRSVADPVAYSEFHQDLNGVSIKLAAGVPIDPALVAAVHHWQKLPFGEDPRVKLFGIVLQCVKSSIMLLLVCVCLLMVVCHYR
uniref:p17 n=1 Tax=Peanut clump virus N TaxID=188886 RepID=Q8B0Y4_9VIRU|nr:P17 [Peanut clump virus N]